MLTQLFCSNIDYGDAEAVLMAYPGTQKIIEVEGGWMVFATEDDATTWAKQE